MDLGISQEQARKKASKLPDGEGETVRRLKQQNRLLQDKLKADNKLTKATCPKCCISKCIGGSSCFAEGK